MLQLAGYVKKVEEEETSSSHSTGRNRGAAHDKSDLKARGGVLFFPISYKMAIDYSHFLIKIIKQKDEKVTLQQSQKLIEKIFLLQMDAKELLLHLAS